MMIAVDLGRAAVIATIPLLSYLDALSVGWIYAAAFATATLTIAFDSGQFAALPNLVSTDDLVTANGRLQASYSAAMVAGPLLAGVLVAVVDLETVFLVDSASFAASAVSLGLVRRSFNPDEPPERKHILRDVSEGLRYVLGHPVLRNISLMMALINFVYATTFTQLVLFASVELDASDTQIAVLFAAGAAGVVCLGLAAGPLRRRLSFSVAALGSLMVAGVLGVVFAFNNVYWLALVLWAATSGLGLFFNINTTSLRQQIVPSHLLGRVVSIAGVMAWSAIPLGALLGGWAIAVTDDVALVYATIGVLIFRDRARLPLHRARARGRLSRRGRGRTARGRGALARPRRRHARRWVTSCLAASHSLCHAPDRQSRSRVTMLCADMGRSTLVVLLSIGALLGSGAVAVAHTTPHWWSVSKARVMLQEGTNLALPADQREALVAEIGDSLKQLRPLQLTAQSLYESTQNPEYARLNQTYGSYIKRFVEAQATLAAGFSIDSAQCVGQGKALVGKFNPEKPGPVTKQYKHFRCNASSYTLEIPNIQLVPGAAPSVPEIVEGARRLVGPFKGVFTVHVTGKSRMLAQRAG